MKTRAAVMTGVGQPVAVEELELRPPGKKEALVQIVAAGVCHSDLHTIQGIIEKPFPIVGGHEGAGVVLEVGEGTTLVKPGDHVILSWVPDCGRCHYCIIGRPNLCDARAPFAAGTLADGTVRFYRGDQPVWHWAGVSCMSEYTVVPETGAIPISKDLPLDRMALVGCAVMTGVGAVINTARAEPGSTVAIFGVGGVGLNVVQGAVLANAGRIIAVDVMDGKLEMARQFGATHTINARSEDPVARIRELTSGAGADYAVEAIGRPETVKQAFLAIRKGGKAIAIGIGAPSAEIPIPAQWLVYGERTLCGCFYGSARVRLEFERMIRFYLDGKLRLDELITRHYRLEEINDAFRAMEAGEVARSVLSFNGR
jgi:S-(hydroxymethyl)glutathione dehydrogenase/alcohol dehydrogenase